MKSAELFLNEKSQMVGGTLETEAFVAGVGNQIQKEKNEKRNESDEPMMRQMESTLEAIGKYKDLVFKHAAEKVHRE